MCWCRPRSSVGLQLSRRAREAHLAPELAQPRVGLRCGDYLEAGTNGLRDAGAAGFLGLLEKLRTAPDTPAAARLILEMVAAMAMHCRTDPHSTAPDQAAAEEVVVDAVVHAYKPVEHMLIETVQRGLKP
jgi:hypothetical protein